jgi:hypothetical protein
MDKQPQCQSAGLVVAFKANRKAGNGKVVGNKTFAAPVYIEMSISFWTGVTAEIVPVVGGSVELIQPQACRRESCLIVAQPLSYPPRPLAA